MGLVACSGGGDEPAAGTSTSDTTSASATAPPRDVPTFTGSADSAFCTLLRGADTSSVLAGNPGDPAQVKAGFQRLVGLLRDAHAVAPPDIERDLALVSAGFETLDASLAAAGYDYEALVASGESSKITEAVNDPAFTAAGARLSAYRSQVCKL